MLLETHKTFKTGHKTSYRLLRFTILSGDWKLKGAEFWLKEKEMPLKKQQGMIIAWNRVVTAAAMPRGGSEQPFLTYSAVLNF